MNDLRQAAQQALEALKKADKISGYANNKKVITALRAALAQQAEPQSTHNSECWRWHHKCAVAKIERECKHD